MRRLLPTLALYIGLFACDKATDPAPIAPTASVSTPAAAAPRGKTFHYDLALTITDGAAKTMSSFTIDLAEGKPGAASIGKNVMLTSNARSDVGARVKANLTMEGDVPKLDLAAEVSAVDATNKVFRMSPKGAAATPLGKATTVIDATDNGKRIEISATAAAASDLGADAKPAGGAVMDITGTHTGSPEPKTTPLSLTINGDAPAVAHKTETKPLQVVDGGVAVPRIDTGTRVKVKSAEAHADGMAIDYDIEMSDVEPGTPALRIRKITGSGHANVPYEKATTLLNSEEDGQKYGIFVTLHRPK